MTGNELNDPWQAPIPPASSVEQPTYPPGQYPPAQYPPAQYPPAQYPPAQYPPAQYPPAQYPPVQYPGSSVATPYPAPAGFQQPVGYPPPPSYPQVGYPPVYSPMGHFPQVGYGPYGFTGVQVAPGQDTKRINRSTYGIVLGAFWVAMFAFVGIGAALVRVPNVPVLMADGTTKKLTSSLIKQGDGCELSLNDSACVAFWNERDVTPQQIKAINSAESKRTLFVLPALPFIIPLFIAQVRRLHDCGRSGAMLLFNLIPCVGFILMIVNASQGGEPYVNKYGPPPRSGINWRALYGKQSVS